MTIRPTVPITPLVRVVTQPTRVTLETVQVRAAWSWSPDRPVRHSPSLAAWSRVY